MKSVSETVEGYIYELPEERKSIINELRTVIANNLPEGFEEVMSYGIIAYVVPHTIYPDGYHCDPKLPLPFLSIASQKNFISLYHMGLYADAGLMDWFIKEYITVGNTKLDMGKSCIRFKNVKAIPMELLGRLASKLSPAQWIEMYEAAFRKK